MKQPPKVCDESFARTVGPSFPCDYAVRLSRAWADHLAPREPDAPTFISLFAGGGGSSLGYSMAGYRELLAVEWLDNAAETLRFNFPDLDVYHGDIAALSVGEVMGRTGLRQGELDVLDGSPPCQGFSTAGRRIIDDPRNQLFREYCRLLRGLAPRAFVMENVSGMVKGKMRLVFAEILRELKSCGYRVTARLMNAKYFGVPQSRERVIFVGVREDLDADPTHPKPAERPVTVWEAVRDLDQINQDPARDHVWVNEVARQTKWIGKAARIDPGQKLIEGVASACRADWNRPLPTIQSSRDGQPPYVRNSTIHPNRPRTLSIREMARCGSFPDEFRFPAPLEHGRHRIGNSVPPLFMLAIARELRTAILRT